MWDLAFIMKEVFKYINLKEVYHKIVILITKRVENYVKRLIAIDTIDILYTLFKRFIKMCIRKMNNYVQKGEQNQSNGIFGKYLKTLNIYINILNYIL